MIRFNLPRLKLPSKFEKIYKTLKSQGILGDMQMRFNFPDEPQFYHYFCQRLTAGKHRIKEGFGYGASNIERKAAIAAIAEAIEHYCILFEQKHLFVRDTYDNLKKAAINPTLFKVFSDSQLKQKSFTKFRFNTSTIFNWIEGYSLTQKRKIFVPAQLVYANYQTEEYEEPTIQLQISTGAACGPDFEFALYRGLCEAIERDAYMISYLNRLNAPLIDVENNEHLVGLKRRIERYNLKAYFVETTLDLPITSVACIIIDKTGIGPAVSTGLGGNLNPQKAITSAALEAVRRHTFARDRFFRSKPPRLPAENTTDGFLMRKQRLWSSPHMINAIQPFIRGSKKSFGLLKNRYSLNNAKNINFIVKALEDKKYEAIVVDVTTDQIRSVGLKVIKVLIPELLPLYHDERFPYKNNWRLYNVPKQLKLISRISKETEINPSHPF